MQRLGFTGISIPKVLGTPLCSLHDLSLPTGRRVSGYLCFIPAQRMQGDEVISKEQAFSVASCLTVTTFGKMLALPRCSRGGEQQHKDKSLACTGLILLLPTDEVLRQLGLVEI